MDDHPGTAVVRSEFTTADPDTAEHFIRSAYVDNDLVLGGDRDSFTFGHRTVGAPDFAVNHMRAGADMSFRAEATSDDPLLVITPVRGRLSYVDNDYGDAHAGRDTPVLVPPLGGLRAICEQLEEVLVPLDRDAVAAHAEATTGVDPRDLVFHDITPISPAMGRYWNATVAHVRDHVLGDSWAADRPILLDQAFRTLASALLSTFPNAALERSGGPDAVPVRGDVTAAALREVVEYVDAHADGPVRPTDLAGLVGRPANEIVESLRRRGRHPSELLWNARLRGVRRDLLDAEGTGSVPELAARWGFGHLARFRTAYVRAFHESPEQTLRR